MQCAAADFKRKVETGDEESSSALSLGDLPQEVLLHIRCGPRCRCGVGLGQRVVIRTKHNV